MEYTLTMISNRAWYHAELSPHRICVLTVRILFVIGSIPSKFLVDKYFIHFKFVHPTKDSGYLMREERLESIADDQNGIPVSASCQV